MNTLKIKAFMYQDIALCDILCYNKVEVPMIEDVVTTLTLLDEELKDSEENYEIIISGGAVMSLYVNSRRTHDVDVVFGKLTTEIKEASERVAKKLNLRSNWLNSAASSFNSQNFELGWENRSVVIFNGSHLIVKAVANVDLIRAKYISYLTRGFDLDDLVILNPIREDIIKLMKISIALNITGRPTLDIILDTDELLRKLNYGPITDSER